MAEPQLYGSNIDGSRNDEFCCYCFMEGEFTIKMEMDAFIELQVKVAREKMGMDEEQARTMAGSVIPTLKRWKV